MTPSSERPRPEVVRPSLGVYEPIFQETAPPPPYSFPRQVWSDFYDNLGSLIMLNLLTSLLALPLAFGLFVVIRTVSHGGLLLLPVVLVIGGTGPAAYGALCGYMARITEHELHSMSDYWAEFRRNFWRSWLTFLGQTGLTAVLLVNIHFYLVQASAVLHVFAFVLLSLSVVWIMANLFVWPMVVRGYRWQAVTRNAFVLAVAAPGRTALFLAIGFILSIIFIVSGAGVVFFLPTLWVLLSNELFVRLRDTFNAAAQKDS